jgi:hypothetical protein
MSVLPATLPFTLTPPSGTLTLVRRDDGEPVASVTVELSRSDDDAVS